MPRKREFPGKQVSLGLLVLRLSMAGMMFTVHGLDKATNFFGKMGGFPDPYGLSSPVSLALAVFAEVLCAGAVALGFFTRWASGALLVNMLTAAFVVHAHDPWSKQEFALLYAFAFLVLIITGPGLYSIDRVR